MRGSWSMRWVEARLRAGQSAELEVRGFSMAPALCDGDRVHVEPLRAGPRVGEIVVMRRGERLVAHRVVAVREGTLVTRGDSCRSEDPPMGHGAVLGRVTERLGRRPWLRARVRSLVYRLGGSRI